LPRRKRRATPPNVPLQTGEGMLRSSQRSRMHAEAPGSVARRGGTVNQYLSTSGRSQGSARLHTYRPFKIALLPNRDGLSRRPISIDRHFHKVPAPPSQGTRHQICVACPNVWRLPSIERRPMTLMVTEFVSSNPMLYRRLAPHIHCTSTPASIVIDVTGIGPVFTNRIAPEAFPLGKVPAGWELGPHRTGVSGIVLNQMSNARPGMVVGKSDEPTAG
jgi:hypothetical protein